jgi:hypothetical protein
MGDTEDTTKLMDQIEQKTKELNDLFLKASEKGLQVQVKTTSPIIRLDVELDPSVTISPGGGPGLPADLEAKIKELYAWRVKAVDVEPGESEPEPE